MSKSRKPAQSVQPQFKPFSWHFAPEHTVEENLAEVAHDIAYGVQLALQIIEADELAAEDGEAPLLNQTQRGILFRFAIASAGLLGDSAHRNIESRNERRRNAQTGEGGSHA